MKLQTYLFRFNFNGLFQLVEMRLVAHELGADGRKVGERRRRRRRDGENGQQLKEHFDLVCLVTSQREIVY
jgi:hypothetical protein